MATNLSHGPVVDRIADAERTLPPGVMACPVCDRRNLPAKHPCRFEIACTCWYGIPCSGRGTVAASHDDARKAGIR